MIRCCGVFTGHGLFMSGRKEGGRKREKKKERRGGKAYGALGINLVEDQYRRDIGGKGKKEGGRKDVNFLQTITGWPNCVAEALPFQAGGEGKGRGGAGGGKRRERTLTRRFLRWPCDVCIFDEKKKGGKGKGRKDYAQIPFIRSRDLRALINALREGEKRGRRGKGGEEKRRRLLFHSYAHAVLHYSRGKGKGKRGERKGGGKWRA